MSLVVAALLVACGGASTSPTSPPDPDPDPGGHGDVASIESVAWLAGTFHAEHENEQTIESWTAPVDGAMYGASRTWTAQGTTFAELLRLAVRDGRVRYTASPQAQATTEFTLTDVAPARAVFTNPAHDFPKRIEYALAGDALTARISGDAGQRTAEWRLTKTGPPPELRAVPGRICVAADQALEITLEPCYCGAEVRCSALPSDGGALDVVVTVADQPCDACLEARGRCELPAGHTGALRLFGAPLLSRTAPGECSPGPVRVLF